MATPLRVGIAGYGVVGKRRRHFIDANPYLKTVAVCDRHFDERGCFDDGVVFVPNYKQLLNESIDVLFVCLTNDIAAEVTMAGLQQGCHVFCEKPPGRDVNDIARVLVCKKQHPDLKLKYGFNHRYHDSISEALSLIHGQSLGHVINLRGVYGKSKILTYAQHLDWRTRRDIAGGGILLDQGIHMVDLLRLFAGEFVDIHSFISNDFWQHDVEDNAYAIMRTAEGKVAMLHSSATQWRHRFQLDISLSKGSIILTGILSGSKSYGAEKITVVWAEEDDRGDPREQTTRYNVDNSWRNEIAEFVDAIRGIGEIKHGTVEDAYQTMSLVYRIYCADPIWRDRWGISAEPEVLCHAI